MSAPRNDREAEARADAAERARDAAEDERMVREWDGANPPQWAYDRAEELHRAFTGSNRLLGIGHAYADMKGAFADYIARNEEAQAEALKALRNINATFDAYGKHR